MSKNNSIENTINLSSISFNPKSDDFSNVNNLSHPIYNNLSKSLSIGRDTDINQEMNKSNTSLFSLDDLEKFLTGGK